MDQPADRRRHPRLSVDASYTARFRAGDRAYDSVPLSDLSAGGICLRIGVLDADPFSKGTMITNLYLEHAGLPKSPLQGQVTWMMGKVPGKQEGFVLVGVEFVGLNPKLEAALASFVAERIGKAASP
jgi:c-di-GMP-binding flagellar brake protein YcgR